MKKGVPTQAERALRHYCFDKSQDIAQQQTPGTASIQSEIREIAERVIDYALDPGTSPGVIEVAFPEKHWNDLSEMYLQCPTTFAFRNFIPENDIDQNSLLVKHLIVVTNWSNSLKVFKATIEHDMMHLMLYSAPKLIKE
jgi:hypothetical protein